MRHDFGDYSGLAFYGGIFYPAWGDNSNLTGDNLEGTRTTLDAYTAAVIVPPLLTISPTNADGVVLSWPNPSTGFVLQESPGVGPASWTNSAVTPEITAGPKQIILTSPAGNRFYRLARP